ncbi:uncharacterized protein E0L32_012387 [Thyridium curvatum]|uniref:Uncharacterized protein n=1 Tax=Thyridium curvatum TaxID=1093900 RepID=A0A507BB54_9PEZI|nr:uncharacterized protein E0L32_012387 [Thyridium curvatum]TPX16783.1 hypothetical protein E0L32_012387 [Thyridium curvatum]
MALPTALTRGIAASRTTSHIMKPINPKTFPRHLAAPSATRSSQIHRSFSTRPALHSQQQQPNAPDKSTNTSANQITNQGQQQKQAPKANYVTLLDQLGATRRTKIVVIVALGIFGTMETIFYVKGFLRWLYPPPEDESEPKVYN